jgi:response regulator RpfG family c-di-GMP phosphodiesterase
MSETILLVDDDVHVLTALHRSLYRDYTIEIAAGAADALDALAHSSYAVVVSDLKMPGTNGIELLKTIKDVAPGTVRVLLTGDADVQTAVNAINEGAIFRFLTKPCPQAILRSTLDAALEQHSLQVAEKELLQETLMGTVSILVEILSVIQPVAFGRAARLRRYVVRIAQELQMLDTWELEAAAVLSQIGCIAVPPELLKRDYMGEPLTEDEVAQVRSHAIVGRNLLHKVPRLSSVSQIIGRQYDRFYPQHSAVDPAEHLVAVGWQMLRVSNDFDRLLGHASSPEDAIAEMRRNASEYNPELLEALARVSRDPDLLFTHIAPTEEPPSWRDSDLFRPIAEEVLKSLRP